MESSWFTFYQIVLMMAYYLYYTQYFEYCNYNYSMTVYSILSYCVYYETHIYYILFYSTYKLVISINLFFVHCRI